MKGKDKKMEKTLVQIISDCTDISEAMNANKDVQSINIFNGKISIMLAPSKFFELFRMNEYKATYNEPDAVIFRVDGETIDYGTCVLKN